MIKITQGDNLRGNYHVKPYEDAILRAFVRYHYLTPGQVARLLYRPSLISYVRDRLRRLRLAGFLDATFLDRVSPPRRRAPRLSAGATGRALPARRW